MAGQARVTRMNRESFAAQLRKLMEELDRLGERDLNERGRLKIEGEIKRDARQLMTEYVESARGLIASATTELAAQTPAAHRRKAIFDRPERFAGLMAALAHVPDSELPLYAKMAGASTDMTAVAALSITAGARGLDAGTARELESSLNVVPYADNYRAAIANVRVAKAELAATLATFAGSGAGTSADAKAALAAAHEAQAVEIDGRVETITEEQLGEAYTVLNIEQGG
jgi:hypothetical protein